MRYLILAIFIFIIAQDMQVKYEAYTVDIDWGGEIETVSEITAPGYVLMVN